MSVINLLLSVGRSFSEWRRRDRAFAQLMALDDHSLADIGVHRSQIAGLIDGVKMPSDGCVPVRFPKVEKLVRHKEA